MWKVSEIPNHHRITVITVIFVMLIIGYAALKHDLKECIKQGVYCAIRLSDNPILILLPPVPCWLENQEHIQIYSNFKIKSAALHILLPILLGGRHIGRPTLWTPEFINILFDSRYFLFSKYF